jgi:4-hydroxybenzoyl-CoA reductase subunit beta
MNKRPDELLLDIHLPPTNGWRASYQKLRRRGAFDFPVLGVAAYVRYESSSEALPHGRATAPSSDALIADAKIVLGGFAPSPVQVSESAQALIGNPLNAEHIAAAAAAAYVKARPLDNTDLVYQWRKQMARQYTIRALESLMSGV